MLQGSSKAPAGGLFPAREASAPWDVPIVNHNIIKKCAGKVRSDLKYSTEKGTKYIKHAVVQAPWPGVVNVLCRSHVHGVKHSNCVIDPLYDFRKLVIPETMPCALVNHNIVCTLSL